LKPSRNWRLSTGSRSYNMCYCANVFQRILTLYIEFATLLRRVKIFKIYIETRQRNYAILMTTIAHSLMHNISFDYVSLVIKQTELRPFEKLNARCLKNVNPRSKKSTLRSRSVFLRSCAESLNLVYHYTVKPHLTSLIRSWSILVMRNTR
jgi:hypothetical protein